MKIDQIISVVFTIMGLIIIGILLLSLIFLLINVNKTTTEIVNCYNKGYTVVIDGIEYTELPKPISKYDATFMHKEKKIFLRIRH